MAESPTNQPHITIGMALDVGRSRAGKPNQDSLGTYQDYPAAQSKLAEKGLLYIVADGMGGAAGGEEASQTAVQATLRGYYDDADTDIQRSLTQAIQQANNSIHDLGQKEPNLRGLGTTIVAAVIHHNQLILGNAGDSRAYLFRQGQLHQISVDHSWVQEQVRRGLITEEQAEVHPQRNVLTRNLGNEPDARPDFATLSLQEGDTFLLCSDGLWGVVSDAELTEILRTEHGQSAAQTLMNLANDHGGPDNIGIILLHVEELPGGAGAATTRTASVPITDRLEPLDDASTTKQMPTARLEPIAAPQATAPPTALTTSSALPKILLALLAVVLVGGLGGYFLAEPLGLMLPGAAEATATSALPTLTSGTLATFTPATTASVVASPSVRLTITTTLSPIVTPAGTAGSGAPNTGPFPAPILLEPANDATFAPTTPITLKWEWSGLYTLGTHFELQIRRDGFPIGTETLNDDTFPFTPEQPGTYTWDVVVVQGEQESILSEERTFIVR
ncbi:MAG: Stp1/IreP family PP2C-type Ser/Thr phosphatase [Ardenticatenales bacterium]|nr:Stp1/IreP family PP2C-type Ser/Thr phosphatase [Ardenticatenales bacterium]